MEESRGRKEGSNEEGGVERRSKNRRGKRMGGRPSQSDYITQNALRCCKKTTAEFFTPLTQQ